MKPSPERRGPNRREFLAFGAGAFTIAALRFEMKRRKVVRRTMPVMGTIAELAVVDANERHAHAAMDAVMDDLRWVERTMTRFNDVSDVGRANLAAAREGVHVTPETALVVTEALRWASASNGAYDPAVGDAVKLWDVTHRHEPPASDAVAKLARRSLYRHVDVGHFRGAPALRFEDPDVSIDLGAIAKGYGVDRAVRVLRDWGITSAVVDVGGDLYALGSAPDGEAWRIGVQDPSNPDGVVATLAASDVALATSGTYVQFFRWRGHRYHHLLDPQTASPRDTPLQSLTIRADSCMHADVAATACYGMSGLDATRVLRARAPGARVEYTI